MVKTILTLLLLLLSINMAWAATYLNEPDGFRNMKWGQSLQELQEKEGLIQLPDDAAKKISGAQNVKIAYKSIINDEIGGAKVSTIHYSFWKDQLFMVSTYCDADNFNALLSSTYNMFGKPTKIQPFVSPQTGLTEGVFYYWDGSRTFIHFMRSYIDTPKEFASLSLWSPSLRAEQQNDKPPVNIKGW